MYEEHIKRIEVEIRSCEDLMNSQNETISTTRDILKEIRAGLSSASAVANTSGSIFSSEEKIVFINDIDRCNNDLTAMNQAGVEMQKNRNKLKGHLDKLNKLNAATWTPPIVNNSVR